MFGIYKSVTNRKIFGVLGGIAKRFDIDATILRIVYLIGCLVSFGFLLLCYLVLALILPNEPLNMTHKRTIRDAKKVK